MKKKWPIRILFMLLCVMMLCSVPAHAVEVRASSRIAHSAASLSQKSNGDLSIYFSVRAADVMEKNWCQQRGDSA